MVDVASTLKKWLDSCFFGSYHMLINFQREVYKKILIFIILAVKNVNWSYDQELTLTSFITSIAAQTPQKFPNKAHDHYIQRNQI